MMTKGISRKGLSSESKGQEIVGLTDPKSQIIDIREGWIHQTIPFDSMYFNNYFMSKLSEADIENSETQVY